MKQPNKQPLETELQPRPEVAEPIAVDLLQRNGIQRTAANLYKLGWNVIPVPALHELISRARRTNGEIKKVPYIHPVDLAARMHFGDGREFCQLFEAANLGLIPGRRSGNLAIIDCDNMRSARTIEHELQRRDIVNWDYTTGRGHNFIIRLAEGELKNANFGKDSKYPGVQIIGQGNAYCILPPSTHISGGFYHWGKYDGEAQTRNIPTVSINDLAWLGVQLAAEAWQEPELYGLPKWTELLSQNNRKILVSAITDGERNSRLSGPVYDLAAHVVRGNIDEAEALQLLYQAAANCEPPYPARQIDSMWKSAINKRDLLPAKEYEGDNTANELYLQAMAFAEQHTWTGRTAQTDRAVFIACAKRVKLDGEEFSLSTRQAAQLANTTNKTAWNALNRLQEQGYIKKVKTSEERKTAHKYQTEPNKYRLNGRAKLLHSTSRDSYVVVLHALRTEHTQQQLDTLQDIFARLGRVAWRVYNHLLQQPEHTIADIARATKQHRSSVTRAINGTRQAGELIRPGLRAYGLVFVSPSEGLYMANQETDQHLAEIAKVIGTDGKAEARRALHQKERELRTNSQLIHARDKWHDDYW